ncbi:retrovirus-related pol polyprotein from transposon TNT 1-94 [Tanacetum coccineum]
MVEKEDYNELSNRFLQLKKHCISIEISIQQKEEIFQSNKPYKNQDSPEFREFFEINELKAQLQAKSSMINNLKKQIKNVHEKSNEAKVKHNIDVIETINIELEHKVAKLLKENETLKKHYKDLYDSIKIANLSEDIQCASLDTRPSMLDRTDFTSWQQRIRLYCRGKENGVNILKSIDEGPFQMGTFWETLTEGTEGAPNLGPERPRVYSDLSPEDKERYNANIRATNILLQGLPKDICSLINHYIDEKDIWDNVKMLLEGSKLTKEDHESQLYDDFEHFRQNKGETIHDYYVRFAKLINDSPNNKITMGRQNRGQGNNAWGGGAAGYRGAQNRVGNANPSQARQIKCYNCNGISHIARNNTQPKSLQNSQYFKDKMLLMQAQENRVALDEEQLLFIAGGQDNAIDEDVDEQPVQDLALNVD